MEDPSDPVERPAQPPRPAPKGSARRVLRSLLPFVWPAGRRDLKIRVGLALIALIAAKGLTVLVPVLLGRAVDALSPKPDMLLVVPVALILGYGAARVSSQVFAELRDALFAKVAQNAIRQVALAVFRHLHRLSLRFHLERQTGGLNRAIDRGTKAIENLLVHSVFSIIPTLVEMVLVASILWAAFDWRYALVTVITVLGYISYTIWATEWRIKFRRQMNESDQAASAKAIDSLLNYETVKYFGNEAFEARRFDVALAAYEKAAVKSRTSLGLLNVGQGVLIAVGVTLVMLLAARSVASGEQSVGTFVTANAFLIQLYLPLNFLGMVYREIKQSLIDMERLYDLLDEEQEIADPPGARPLVLQGGAVTFRDVRFGYDPRRPILKGLSFHVPAGRTLALVGATGSGKSTVARLLYRFYDVDGGAIEIDGQDIRGVTQDSVRAAIGIVPQDTVLFNDTLFYNIAYGRPGATRAEVEEAARLASLSEFVGRLPDGWDTLVGERGLKLSGGEKQRVAIARAILKHPAILIFDEATSALDSGTEAAVQEALRQVSVQHTTLVIAHRLSTVVDADEILVLQQGQVAERGTHAALLARDGLYAELWNRQLRGDGAEAA